LLRLNNYFLYNVGMNINALPFSDPAAVASRQLENHHFNDKVGGKTALYRAVEAKKLDEVIALIKMGADPFIVDDKTQNSCFHLAARQANPEVLTELSKAHIPAGQLESRNSRGFTPFYIACGKGNKEAAAALLAIGAAKDCKCRPKEISALHVAAINDHANIIELFKDAGPEIVDARDKDGFTPLHVACANGNKEAAAALLAIGAAKDCKAGPKERSALHVAAGNGHANIIELFKDSGPEIVDATDKDGWTPLHLACVTGKKEAAAALLAIGAAKESKGGPQEQSALHIAALAGHASIIELFKDSGPEVIDAKDNAGWSPLHTACTAGKKETAAALIAIGAAKDCKGVPHEQSALHMAAWMGHTHIIELFTGSSLEIIDATDSKGLTPLDIAFNNGFVDTGIALLQLSAAEKKYDLEQLRAGKLPEGLQLNGDFQCIPGRGDDNLTHLPRGLQIAGDLYLCNCPIQELPENLKVGGNILLSGCFSLSELPDWISTLGPRADGQIREIHLNNTGLSQETLDALMQTDHPGIEFVFEEIEEEGQEDSFASLYEAFDFWLEAVEDNDLSMPEIQFDQFQDKVLLFLYKLASTAEYENPIVRPLLAKRVLELFRVMQTNEEIKERAVDLIFEGVSTCGDRVTTTLDAIELMILLHKIEHSPNTEAELRELGKRFFLLDMVTAKAKACAAKIKNRHEELEVVLAFHIFLADRFNLPVQSRDMLFLENHAKVTPEQIKAAGDEIEQAYSDLQLELFLKNWSPWIAYERSLAIPSYDELPIAEDCIVASDAVCLITHEPPVEPVIYNNNLYDYGAFIEQYKNSGKDPLNGDVSIDLSLLRRLSS